jgi:hypothetical protein
MMLGSKDPEGKNKAQHASRDPKIRCFELLPTCLQNIHLNPQISFKERK